MAPVKKILKEINRGKSLLLGAEKEASLKEGEQKNCPPSSANLVDRLVEGWHEAACQAWEEVLKEILKEKIRLKWGAELERGAQAYVESMDKSWRLKLLRRKPNRSFAKE